MTTILKTKGKVMIKILLIFTVIALGPVLSISWIVAFAAFDINLLWPASWGSQERGLAASWIIFIYGLFLVGWVRVEIENLS